MSGAGVILAINLSVAGFLAAAFAAIAIYDPVRLSARWFALGYAFGLANFLLEFAVAASGVAGVLSVGAYLAFMAALVAFNAGLARLCGVEIPWRTMAVLFAAALAIRLAIDGMDRDSFLRMMLYQSPYAAMQAIGAWLVWRSRDRRPLALLLFGVLVLTTIHYLSKPFLSYATGGTGSGPETYLQTNYAMFSLATGTVLGLAVALLLLVTLVRNVLSHISERSATDPLSGLYNRRGFEERRRHALEQRALNGMPVSLIACDLDRFKSINDTLGHAAGDTVIAAFGSLIRRALQPHQSAGRIGGEEFAILLPGSNLAAARLFAESLRSAFALLELDGLPGHRFTASFGVAELRHGESVLELEARADAALYAAKRAGRDRVEASPNPGTQKRRSSDQ